MTVCSPLDEAALPWLVEESFALDEQAATEVAPMKRIALDAMKRARRCAEKVDIVSSAQVGGLDRLGGEGSPEIATSYAGIIRIRCKGLHSHSQPAVGSPVLPGQHSASRQGSAQRLRSSG